MRSIAIAILCILLFGAPVTALARCDAISAELFDTLRATPDAAAAVADAGGMSPFNHPLTITIDGMDRNLSYFAHARPAGDAKAAITRQQISEIAFAPDKSATNVTVRIAAPDPSPWLQRTMAIVILGCSAAAATGPDAMALVPGSGARPPEILVFAATERTLSTPFSGAVWAAAILLVCAVLLRIWAGALGTGCGGLARGFKLMFSNFSGRISLSHFQLFVFFVAVLGAVAYAFGRTRALSDLSQDVLLLLGISAVTTTAATIGDVSRNRLDWVNWIWLGEQGAFLPPDKIKLEWFQLVSTGGGFDMYRFQALMFTVLVAPTFVIMSVYSLGDARIPPGILAVLGLSQATYIFGKIFSPPTIAEFDAQITDYRDKQKAGTATADDRGKLLAAFKAAMDDDWADPKKLTI